MGFVNGWSFGKLPSIPLCSGSVTSLPKCHWYIVGHPAEHSLYSVSAIEKLKIITKLLMCLKWSCFDVLYLMEEMEEQRGIPSCEMKKFQSVYTVYNYK